MKRSAIRDNLDSGAAVPDYADARSGLRLLAASASRASPKKKPAMVAYVVFTREKIGIYPLDGRTYHEQYARQRMVEWRFAWRHRANRASCHA